MLICIILNLIPDRAPLLQDSTSGVSGMALVSFQQEFGSGPGSDRPDFRSNPALYFQASDRSFTPVTSTALRRISSEPSAGFIQRPEVPTRSEERRVGKEGAYWGCGSR